MARHLHLTRSQLARTVAGAAFAMAASVAVIFVAARHLAG